jgi:flagellin
MIINHNIPAMFSSRQLLETGWNLEKSMEKLSSGMRINRAGDDASGLAVSEKMRGQIRGLAQAGRNAQDGISYIQVAEGALNETHSILHRMRELAIQTANGIYTPTDRQMVNVEVSQLAQEVDRIALNTEFNKRAILSGDPSSLSVRLHVGANADQSFSMYIRTMTATALNVAQGQVSISTPELANSFLARVDKATETVSMQRANLGAWQNRLEHTMTNLAVAVENTQASESRIRDTDMAKEMVNYTRGLILMRSGLAMLAQANIQPQSVLQILG